MQDAPILLNPRYLKSGFRSQSRNIRQSLPLRLRKIACLAETVSVHILKHGAFCYASSTRLINVYNETCTRYGCRPIAERTLSTLLGNAEEAGVINRQYFYNQQTGQRQRYIELNINGLKSMFAGVVNYARQAANKFLNRQNKPIGRSGVDNIDEPCNDKGFAGNADHQNGVKRSNDLSKERKNKNNGSRRLSYDDFLIKSFGADADEVKSLQEAARNSKHSDKPITASGAKRLIELHNQHGYPLAPSFTKFLNHIIAKEHHRNKWLRDVTIATYKVGDMTDQEAIEAANNELRYWETTFVERGYSEIVIDKATGIARVRNLTDSEVKRAAAIRIEREQAILNEPAPFRDAFSEVFGSGRKQTREIASGRNVFERISNTWGE